MSAVGDIKVGTVVKVFPNFAILLFEHGETGLLHISELSNKFVHNFTGYVQVGNIYKVKVIEADETLGSIKVSIKALSHEGKHHMTAKNRIENNDISFDELSKRLPEWVKEENEKHHDD